MNDFPLSELWRLPYVATVPGDGRKVLLQKSYFDGDTQDWHLYFRPDDATVGRIAGGEVAYGTYFAKTSADPRRDLEMPLSTLITQHLSFPALINPLGQFETDVQNCAAVLEKYHLIASAPEQGGYASLLVSTELEYLLALVRSIYDILSGIVRKLAMHLIVGEDGKPAVPKQIPESFAGVALKGDAVLRSDDIVASRGLPYPLASWYADEATAFRVIRRMRDAVIHRGEHLPTVFQLPNRGLAVIRDEKPWADLSAIIGTAQSDEKFTSLRLLVASLVNQVLGASTRLARTIAISTCLPIAIHGDIRVFLRSAASARLVQLPDTLHQPWEDLVLSASSDEAAVTIV